jgi:hypothetical protein
MLIELVSLKRNNNGSYGISKILLNPRHIVSITEDIEVGNLLSEGKIDIGIHRNAEFSRVRMNYNGDNSEITVFGTPDQVQSKISKKQILRG